MGDVDFLVKVRVCESEGLLLSTGMRKSNEGVFCSEITGLVSKMTSLSIGGVECI